MPSTLARGGLAAALAVVLSLGGTGSALAQAPPQAGQQDLTVQDLMGLEVQVGSLEGSDLLSAPSIVSVIDSAMIREFNLQSVTEALDLVAGFAVLRTHLKRDLPTARGLVQDHYANKVLLLINGVPTWMGVTGEGALARIDIHDVDRIEVLKGPASVLYGTNAYVGAVNIVLKDPAQHRSEAQLGASEHFGFASGGNLLVSASGLDLMVSANAADAPGDDFVFTDEAGVSGRIDESMSSRNFTLSGKRGGHSLLFNAYNASESFLGLTPAFSAGAGLDHQLRGALANYTFTSTVASRVGLTLGLTYDWNQRDFARRADDLERARVQGYRLSGTAKAVVQLATGLNLQGGIDWERRTSQKYDNYNPRKDVVVAENDMRDRHVDGRSAFLQLAYSPTRWRLLAGARYNDDELFGGHLAGRATVVYLLGESSSLKLMGGQSYRVPSLFELYFRTPTNTVYGNTALEPETNDTVELVFTTRHGNLLFEGLVYHARYDNRIYRVRRYPTFVSDPRDTSTIYVNGSRFGANGLELEGRYRLPGNLSAFAAYALVDGDHGDEVAGSDHYNFKYVPKHTFAGGLTKYVGRFWASGVARFQSEIGAPHETIGEQAYFDLTLGFGHRLGHQVLRHTLSVKNVADKQERTPEYVRRVLNEVPSGYGQRIAYLLQVGF